MKEIDQIHCQCGEVLFRIIGDELGYREINGGTTSPVKCGSCGTTYRILDEQAIMDNDATLQLIRIG